MVTSNLTLQATMHAVVLEGVPVYIACSLLLTEQCFIFLSNQITATVL